MEMVALGAYMLAHIVDLGVLYSILPLKLTAERVEDVPARDTYSDTDSNNDKRGNIRQGQGEIVLENEQVAHVVWSLVMTVIVV